MQSYVVGNEQLAEQETAEAAATEEVKAVPEEAVEGGDRQIAGVLVLLFLETIDGMF